ncbi:MAG TPA: hypothetical protein VIL21_08140 [Solirubrobacterales bacterium]|jgi:CapZ-interacting protein
MSILDDAIREHLELKRAHGADEAELKKLEDEAFGPAARPEEPDPFAEAPTEFMAQPEAPEAAEPTAESGRRIDIADLQEPPAPPEPPQDEAPPVPAEDAAQSAPPAEEALAEDAATGLDEEPAAGDRQAIAEQPTEFFDVESEMEADDAPSDDAPAAEEAPLVEAPPVAEAPSPSDEQIVEAEQEEPTLTPVVDEDEEDEEFWSEQRLSDELDQALEAPLSERLEEEDSPVKADDDFKEEDEQPRANFDPDTGHEDVLEDTPDFLEDAPEDDELWFEQRPPKDFDFDD